MATASIGGAPTPRSGVGRGHHSMTLRSASHLYECKGILKDGEEEKYRTWKLHTPVPTPPLDCIIDIKII